MSRIPVDPEPEPGQVVRAGNWAVANVQGRHHAVGRVCRHQFADLSRGSIDENGCLVCPWHYSAYNLEDGRMVRGPQGFLALRRHIPGYDRFVKAYSRYLPLKRRRVVREDGRLYVADD